MHFRVLCLLVSPALCFPLINEPQNSTQENEDYDYEFYDQRQNGTENYRINVNGVVFFLAPLKSLLAVPSIFDSGITDGADEGVIDLGLPNATVSAPNKGRERTYKTGSPKTDRNVLQKPKVSKLKQVNLEEDPKRNYG